MIPKKRIGNTLDFRFILKTNGVISSLQGRNLSVLIKSPVNVRRPLAFSIEGDAEIVARFEGKDQTNAGIYTIEVYENKDNTSQAVLDFDAVELVPRTYQSCDVDTPKLVTEVLNLGAFNLNVSVSYNGITSVDTTVNSDGNNVVTITLDNGGTRSFVVKNGKDGLPGPIGLQGPIGPTGPAGPKGADGISPSIGYNGNWFIGSKDTGVPATGNSSGGSSDSPVRPIISSDSKTLYINPETYGITEGFIQCDFNGAYTEEQYEVMYLNAKGFTTAITYAIDNGYNKVVFPRGLYCFTPITTSQAAGQVFNAIIWIRNANNIDIDLNGCTLQVLLNSSVKSTYDKAYLKTPKGNNAPHHHTAFALIGVDFSNNVTIHDGTLIGDRLVRKWLKLSSSTYPEYNKEVEEESTYGIRVSHYSHNTNIYNMDISMFMGDAVATINQGSISNDYHKGSGYSGTTNSRGISYLYKYGIYYSKDNSDVITRNESINTGYAISTLITVYDEDDSVSQVYNNGLIHSNIRKLKEEKHYSIYHGGGNDRSISVAEYFSILTFGKEATNVRDFMPKRIIPSSHMKDFILQKDEYKIAIQVARESDIAIPVVNDDGSKTYSKREFDMTITGYTVDNTTIQNCYIHDNHRGGITGFFGNTRILNNKFYKGGTKLDSIPIFTVQGTNYHIDNEDVTGSRLEVRNNEFYSANTANVGSLFFLNCRDFIFEGNRANSSVYIDKIFKTEIFNNIFYGGGIHIRKAYDDTSGINKTSGKYTARIINIRNNYMLSMPIMTVDSTNKKVPVVYETTVNFNNNFVYLSSSSGFSNTSMTYTFAFEEFSKHYFVENNYFKCYGSSFSTEYVAIGRWRNNKLDFSRVSGAEKQLYWYDFDSSNIIFEGSYNLMDNPIRIGLNNIQGYNGSLAFSYASSFNIPDSVIKFKDCKFSKPINKGLPINKDITIIFENCKFTNRLNTYTSGLFARTGSPKATVKFINCDFSEFTSTYDYIVSAINSNDKYIFKDCIVPSNLKVKSGGNIILPEGKPNYPDKGELYINNDTVEIYTGTKWLTIS